MAGSAFTGSTLDFALERFLPTGAIDTAFGKHGRVTTPIGTGNDGAEALAVDANGTIVAAGYAMNGSDRDFALARYADDGTLLRIFGQGGVAATSLGSTDSGRDVAFDASGNVLVAGYATTGSNADFAVLRYLGVGYRVDAMIKRPSDITYTGDDVYGATGAGELRAAKGKLGSSVSFSYAVQNEGTAPDGVTVRGCGDSAGFSVAYAHGAADVTADVEAGTFALGPEAVGGTDGLTVTITVQPSAMVGTAKTCKVTATSQGAPASADVAKAKVKAVS